MALGFGFALLLLVGYTFLMGSHVFPESILRKHPELRVRLRELYGVLVTNRAGGGEALADDVVRAIRRVVFAALIAGGVDYG